MAHLLADRFWTGPKTFRRPNSEAGRSPLAESLALRAADRRRAVSSGNRFCVANCTSHCDGRWCTSRCSKSRYRSPPGVACGSTGSGPIIRSEGQVSARRSLIRSDRGDAASPGSGIAICMSAPVPPGCGTLTYHGILPTARSANIARYWGPHPASTVGRAMVGVGQ